MQGTANKYIVVWFTVEERIIKDRGIERGDVRGCSSLSQSPHYLRVLLARCLICSHQRTVAHKQCTVLILCWGRQWHTDYDYEMEHLVEVCCPFSQTVANSPGLGWQKERKKKKKDILSSCTVQWTLLGNSFWQGLSERIHCEHPRNTLCTCFPFKVFWWV